MTFSVRLAKKYTTNKCSLQLFKQTCLAKQSDGANKISAMAALRKKQRLESELRLTETILAKIQTELGSLEELYVDEEMSEGLV